MIGHTVITSPQDLTAQQFFGLGSLYRPYNILRFCTTYLFGEQVSHSVLPAQDLKYDADYVYGTDQIEITHAATISQLADVNQILFNVKTHDGAELEGTELIHETQAVLEPEERKYIIYIPGNGMSYQDTLRDMLEDCVEMNWNIVGFNFRGVLRSTGTLQSQLDLITDLIAQVERLKKQGIKPENIKLLGHSTGAAVATLVAYVYYLHDEHLQLFNGRSFSSYPDFMYHQLETDRQKTWLGPFVRLKYTLTNFELPALEYYQKLPSQDKDYIVVEADPQIKNSVRDGVIPDPASLHFGLSTKLAPQDSDQDEAYIQDRKVLSFYRMGCGHNDFMKYLECSSSRTTARERYRQFFKRQ